MIAEKQHEVISAGRNSAVDLLKTIAIIGVVTIHVSYGGYGYPIGSFNWYASLFWGCLTRASVPVFLMCSGALLLDPQKQLTLRSLYGKNLLRIVTAMLFWAMAYKIYGLLGSGGGITVQAVIQSIKEVVLLKQEFHLYYLHIIILVYVFLPITRILTASATKAQFLYILAVWFVLGIVYPTAREFWPFTLLSGVPLKWMINMAYSAIGYGILGYCIKAFWPRKPGMYLLLYLLGFIGVFGGTAAMSLSKGMLYQSFLEGMSPGVAVMATGIFGMVVSKYQGRESSAAAKNMSGASFCIFLVHMFFLYIFTGLGFTVQLLPCLVSIPVLVASVLGCSYLTYFILFRIPVINRYLI